ncbi:ribonuclease T [Tahibacter aquaticus]|nr:ribonuclease T [Tahibacter aquaticus]
MSQPPSLNYAQRFRGFLPVVVDVETGGFDSDRDALLEIAAVVIRMDNEGWVHPEPAVSTHVVPFPGANIDPRALEITGIDPTHPFRAALDEKEALDHIFRPVRKAMREADCQRAILVGHNASFDLGFLNAAIRRTGHKRSPFHLFSCFDTATLAGLAYGQTVLSKAVAAAGMDWNSAEAHSAVYDTEQTAKLFCGIVNRWKAMDDAYRSREIALPAWPLEAAVPGPHLPVST